MRVLVGLLAAGVLWPANPARAVITNVDAASDVCSPTANPCSITQTVKTVPGAVLDFGLREVRITGSGLIDAGTGDLTLLCGKLLAQKSGNAIQMKGTAASGGSGGGFGRFVARRGCSANRTLPCVRDAECAAVSAGTCSFGSGDILLAGKVLGSADAAGGVQFIAAGNINVSSVITVNGTALESDAGVVELDAQGDVNVSARIQVSAGGQGTGGEVCLTAGRNIVVSDLIDATGGDFDGGVVEMIAGGSLTVTDDIKANSTSGEGFGGELTLESGGYLIIVGGGATNRLLLDTDGHQSAENFGGDGGSQDLVAGGNVHIGRFVRLTSDGAPPDGFGEAITIDSAGDVLIEGEVQAKGGGGSSGGGEVEVSALGVIEISPTGMLDVSGTDGGGGDVALFGDSGIVMSGTITAKASPQGLAGSVDLDSSGGALTIGGTIDVDGTGGGLASFSGCDIRLVSGADISNKPPGGLNRFVAREKFTALAGSDAHVGVGGTNLIAYRTNAKPPVVAGSMTPAPRLELTPQLIGCPVCGNRVVEFGETCDDGDTTGGDGCSANCQDEGCIADTPGYPAVALCDDGDNCTVDVCNPQTSSCNHSASCDDGIDCTVDTCQGTTCVNTPDDSFCDGINECAISICSPASGCVVETPLEGPCDDGQFCNGADTCNAGQCSVHTGSPCIGFPECQDGCNEARQTCGSPFGTPCTSDGSICTDNVCDGAGTCVTIPNSSPCDDGIFCNGNDVCSNGSCSFHAGPPCVLSGDCRDVCDEGAQTCQTPAGEPCRDDRNSCTDDICDGSGTCLHVETSGSCDGEDFCTVGGVCVAGECVASDGGTAFSSTRIILLLKSGPADDQFVIKAEFAADAIQGAPAEEGIRLALRSSEGDVSYESFMPAANVTAKGRASARAFKFKDAKGLVAEANGVRKGNVKHVAAKRRVRVKFRMKGRELGALLDAPDLLLSLLLGDDPLTGDCVSSDTALICERKGSKSRCGD
ncbi:MAG: hypothetical protein V3R77_06865 [Candidatus Binatia bacterium]